jgi:hypothetical protein
MNILVGCDPEVFVKKSGKFLSAHNLIPGDKKNPYKVPNGAVQVDGMALEFNIEPVSSEDGFLFNVKDVLTTMKLMVPGLEVVAEPVAHFDEEYFKNQPPKAKEMGCDPDFDAWTLDANIKPDSSAPMRTAGGHVHIGWTSNKDVRDYDHFIQGAEIAREMDFYLGLSSLFYDRDVSRREMYGRGGCFRPKPYGVEYRTLSNAWLATDNRIKWVFRSTKRCVENYFSGKKLQDKYGDISAIINNSDVYKAKSILVEEGLEVCYG